MLVYCTYLSEDDCNSVILLCFSAEFDARRAGHETGAGVHAAGVSPYPTALRAEPVPFRREDPQSTEHRHPFTHVPPDVLRHRGRTPQ